MKYLTLFSGKQNKENVNDSSIKKMSHRMGKRCLSTIALDKALFSTEKNCFSNFSIKTCCHF